MPPEVAAAFAAFPAPVRRGCLALRDLVFDVAADTPEAGRISEELRWGQPAYLTPDTRAGSTIRIGRAGAKSYALFVHCQTTLIADFREIAPHLRFEGNRAVVFDAAAPPDDRALAQLMRAALTWHIRKRGHPAAGRSSDLSD